MNEKANKEAAHCLQDFLAVEFIVSHVCDLPHVLHVGADQHLSQLGEVTVAFILNCKTPYNVIYRLYSQNLLHSPNHPPFFNAYSTFSGGVVTRKSCYTTDASKLSWETNDFSVSNERSASWYDW